MTDQIDLAQASRDVAGKQMSLSDEDITASAAYKLGLLSMRVALYLDGASDKDQLRETLRVVAPHLAEPLHDATRSEPV